MTSYVFIDREKKLLGKLIDDKIVEIKFFDSLIGNIYRGRVVNKIDALNGYFVEYDKGESLYLNSTIPYKIGDNVIVQYVRDPANGKLALGSLNFKIENESYSIKRFPPKAGPRLKKGKKKDNSSYKEILERKTRLIEEEKFFPTPKILYENSYLSSYLSKNKDLEVREVNIDDFNPYKEVLKLIKDPRPSLGDSSLIIDQLETLTVIDVNSSAEKSKNNKDKFLENINLKLIDLIIYNLKIRNIGGMVLIDFLRNKDKEKIEESFRQKAEEKGLECEIYGFSPMGLFEMTIKRRGASLIDELRRRKLLL